MLLCMWLDCKSLSESNATYIYYIPSKSRNGSLLSSTTIIIRSDGPIPNGLTLNTSLLSVYPPAVAMHYILIVLASYRLRILWPYPISGLSSCRLVVLVSWSTRFSITRESQRKGRAFMGWPVVRIDSATSVSLQDIAHFIRVHTTIGP